MDKQSGDDQDDSLQSAEKKFVDLCEKIRNKQSGALSKKNLFGAAPPQKIHLRPSMIDRACFKSTVVSSTPNPNVNKKQKEFIRDISTSVSPIEEIDASNHLKGTVARLRFTEGGDKSVITISSTDALTDNDKTQNEVNPGTTTDKKKENLMQLVTKISKAVETLNTTNKTVQTSANSSTNAQPKSALKKLARRSFFQKNKERETQTGISLDRNDLVAKTVSPSCSSSSSEGSETTDIVKNIDVSMVRNSFKRGTSAKDLDRNEHKKSGDEDGPWRLPSGLRADLPLSLNSIGLKTDLPPSLNSSVELSDDTFLPKSLKQKKVFTNKKKLLVGKAKNVAKKDNKKNNVGVASNKVLNEKKMVQDIVSQKGGFTLTKLDETFNKMIESKLRETNETVSGTDTFNHKEKHKINSVPNNKAGKEINKNLGESSNITNSSFEEQDKKTKNKEVKVQIVHKKQAPAKLLFHDDSSQNFSDNTLNVHNTRSKTELAKQNTSAREQNMVNSGLVCTNTRDTMVKEDLIKENLQNKKQRKNNVLQQTVSELDTRHGRKVEQHVSPNKTQGDVGEIDQGDEGIESDSRIKSLRKRNPSLKKKQQEKGSEKIVQNKKQDKKESPIRNENNTKRVIDKVAEPDTLDKKLSKKHDASPNKTQDEEINQGDMDIEDSTIPLKLRNGKKKQQGEEERKSFEKTVKNKTRKNESPTRNESNARKGIGGALELGRHDRRKVEEQPVSPNNRQGDIGEINQGDVGVGSDRKLRNRGAGSKKVQEEKKGKGSGKSLVEEQPVSPNNRQGDVGEINQGDVGVGSDRKLRNRGASSKKVQEEKKGKGSGKSLQNQNKQKNESPVRNENNSRNMSSGVQDNLLESVVNNSQSVISEKRRKSISPKRRIEKDNGHLQNEVRNKASRNKVDDTDNTVEDVINSPGYPRNKEADSAKKLRSSKIITKNLRVVLGDVMLKFKNVADSAVSDVVTENEVVKQNTSSKKVKPNEYASTSSSKQSNSKRPSPKKKPRPSTKTKQPEIIKRSRVDPSVVDEGPVRRSGRERRVPPPRSVGVLICESEFVYNQYQPVPVNGNNNSVVTPNQKVRKRKSNKARQPNSTVNTTKYKSTLNNLSPIPDEPALENIESTETGYETGTRIDETTKSRENIVLSGKISKKRKGALNKKKIRSSLTQTLSENDTDEMNYFLNICQQDRVRLLRCVFSNPKFKNIKGMNGVTTAVTQGFPTGLIKIQPGKGKPKQVAANHQMSFSVIEGEARFGIQDKCFDIKKSDMFLVPAGCEYYIKNRNNNEELLLTFTKLPKD